MADNERRPAIDPAELAAFIDGRLAGVRRRTMIERLADDEEAYELYDEVVRAREDYAGAAAGAPATATPVIAPFRRRDGPVQPAPWRFGWWAAAAALVLGVLLGWLALRPTSSVAPSSVIVARLGPALSGPRYAELRNGADLPAFRSGDPNLFSEAATHFRLGVRSFDLAVAAAADDPERSERWLMEISHLLHDAIPLGSASEQEFEALAHRLSEGGSPLALRDRIAAGERALEGEIEDVEPAPYFAFGRWAEAIRCAAVAEDRDFLGSHLARDPIPGFLGLGVAPRLRDALNELDRELRRGDDADLETIESAVAAIFRACSLAGACLEP